MNNTSSNSSSSSHIDEEGKVFSWEGGYSIDCPCLNASLVFESLSNCRTKRTGEAGITPQIGSNECYPLSYGSNVCGTYDLPVDPHCSTEPIPSYCFQSWCYVDFDTCKYSSHVVRRSLYFPKASLYYSYTTCNASATAFGSTTTTSSISRLPTLQAIVPTLWYPHHFKRNVATGDVVFIPPRNVSSESVSSSSSPAIASSLSSSSSSSSSLSSSVSLGESYYYDSSIPFEGAVIDYVDAFVASVDDIRSIDYVYRSKGSDLLHPLSSFTATVRDVQVGIADMGIGPFWVTAERLKMTAFTVPVHIDKIVLAVPQPTEDKSFLRNIEKVLQPFSPSLWYLLLLVIFLVACLSVWFAGPKANNTRPWLAFRNRHWETSSMFRKCTIVFRQVLEAIMQHGIFLFGNAVDQDFQSTLSHKLLMFGFSILIIVVSSSYVANLAAFLTLPEVTNYIDSMERAIASQAPVCAHIAVKEELQTRWPKANFVFNEVIPGYDGILQSYDQGKCDAIAVSITDTRYDVAIMEQFCQRHIVFTNGLVYDIPMAFPVKKELAAGISHWLYTGQKQHNLLFGDYYTAYEPILNCSVNIELQGLHGANNLPSLTTEYMLFPFFLLAIFATLAVILKLYHKENEDAYLPAAFQKDGANNSKNDNTNLEERRRASIAIMNLARSVININMDDIDSSASSLSVPPTACTDPSSPGYPPSSLQYPSLSTQYPSSSLPYPSSSSSSLSPSHLPLEDDKFQKELSKLIKASVVEILQKKS